MTNGIEGILDSNEKIIWRGKPKYIAFILKFISLTIFGLFWYTLLIPFYWAFFTGKFPILVFLVLEPHTFIGLGMLTAPLWVSLMYPYVEYAITSKRIIFQSGFLPGISIRLIT